MSVSIEVGQTGQDFNLSNANFDWLAGALRVFGLKMDAQTEALLPSQVIAAIDAFYQHIGRNGGHFDYTDEATCARIKDFLVPGKMPMLEGFLAADDATGGAQVIDLGQRNWADLGSLRNPNSEAHELWNRLLNYMRWLRYLAAAAQNTNEILRVY